MLENINQNQVSLNTLQGYQRFNFEATSVSASITSGKQTVSVSMDKVTIQGESSFSAVTYNGDMTLNGKQNDNFGMLRKLVTSLLKQQGIDTKISTGDNEIDIASLSPEEAGELVADDGYFGVEKTSERIFQFAVGVAGGDPSRLDAIKKGVQQGLDEAEKAFGGKLPDISYKTIDKVMEKLDKWAKENQPSSH